MKKLILLFLLSSQGLIAQQSNDELLMEFKNSFQYNKMDSLNEVTKGKNYFFYKSVYENVTNHPDISLKLLKKNRNKQLKNSFEYVKLVNDNASKTYDYQKANETSLRLINEFKDQYTLDELNEEINNQRIWEVLKNSPKQTISAFTKEVIKTKTDLAGLQTIEVKNGDFRSDFVFDTGAGLSCITTSQAEKLGVTLLPDNNIEVESFTGQKNKVRIGVANSLTIGAITIKNAVFLIYPDEAFTFAEGKYVINGIIGFPIAKDLGTLTFENDLITVSKETIHPNYQKNFFIDHLRPIVMVKYNGKVLPNNLDSGATWSLFTKTFYETFKDYIDAKSTLEVTKHAGAGAEVIENEIKILKNETIFIGNTKIDLNNLKIDHLNYGVYGKSNYGNIGQDVLKPFKKVTMSFDQNYLLLEN